MKKSCTSKFLIAPLEVEINSVPHFSFPRLISENLSVTLSLLQESSSIPFSTVWQRDGDPQSLMPCPVCFVKRYLKMNPEICE